MVASIPQIEIRFKKKLPDAFWIRETLNIGCQSVLFNLKKRQLEPLCVCWVVLKTTLKNNLSLPYSAHRRIDMPGGSGTSHWPCWRMPCSSRALHSSSPCLRLGTSPFCSSQSMSWQPGKERWYATPLSSRSWRMESLLLMRLNRDTQVCGGQVLLLHLVLLSFILCHIPLFTHSFAPCFFLFSLCLTFVTSFWLPSFNPLCLGNKRFLTSVWHLISR